MSEDDSDHLKYSGKQRTDILLESEKEKENSYEMSFRLNNFQFSKTELSILKKLTEPTWTAPIIYLKESLADNPHKAF